MQGESFNAPEPCPAGASLPELVNCVQQLLDVFVANGFAIKVLPSSQAALTRDISCACIWPPTSSAPRV